MDAIVQLHGYVESGFATISREFVAVRQEFRQEIQSEVGGLQQVMQREFGKLQHDMNRRFDRVDERFDALESRVGRLEGAT
ncbi:MAG: hypothetical protein ACLPYS_09680 [Vulcanimicrobiaceae bacterium]